MIKAYENSLVHGFPEYIKSTTVTGEKSQVVKNIQNYLTYNKCSIEVQDALNAILNNETLLNKTHIVWDGSYRNCVLLVTPSEVRLTHELAGKPINVALKTFADEAEIFFLILKEERVWSYMGGNLAWD